MAMNILGPNGRPISSAADKPKPKIGNAFGRWAGRDLQYEDRISSLSGMIQFDLDKLELQDYRSMRNHYQVNSSLAVLSFMQHQSDFHIEGGKNNKVRDTVESQLRGTWTQLNRALSNANWAGYAPCALEWENDTDGREVRLSKVKDLLPEECQVNWKKVEGWAPPGHVKPTYFEFDGIKQFGLGWPIPVESAFYFPILMEHGDYSGRKLLKPAFQSWFFSILLHLYANRYYERHGEPLPIGRAPFDETIEVDGQDIPGNRFLLETIQSLRSRTAVVLPSSKEYDKDGKASYEYSLDLLETQQRGADFEKYLNRLDEEITLALFTPVLLMRTADVGSYNLGVGHMQMFSWMLNALNDDRADYINKYLIRKIVDYNFGTKTDSPNIVFRKMGTANSELLREIVVQLVRAKDVKVDVKDLGIMTGMKLEEIEQTLAPSPAPTPNADPVPDPSAPGQPGQPAKPGKNDPKKDTKRQDPGKVPTGARAIVEGVTSRIAPQIDNAFARSAWPEVLSFGYKRQLEDLLRNEGISDIEERVTNFYASLDRIVADLPAIRTPEEYKDILARAVEILIEVSFK